MTTRLVRRLYRRGLVTGYGTVGGRVHAVSFRGGWYIDHIHGWHVGRRKVIRL